MCTENGNFLSPLPIPVPEIAYKLPHGEIIRFNKFSVE